MATIGVPSAGAEAEAEAPSVGVGELVGAALGEGFGAWVGVAVAGAALGPDGAILAPLVRGVGPLEALGRLEFPAEAEVVGEMATEALALTALEALALTALEALALTALEAPGIVGAGAEEGEAARVGLRL